MKGKSKRILVVAVKWRRRANGLLLINILSTSRVLHVPLLRLIIITGVYSRRCSYSFGNGFVSIWSQGLVDVSGRSARVIIKCRSRFHSIKITNLMLAPVSHFVCFISLQSYWETITSQSVQLRLAVKRIVIQEAWTVYDLIWTRVEFLFVTQCRAFEAV